MWFHVDGAYAAAAASSERECCRLRDIGCADSISIDPHKWLFQPYEAAALMVSDRTKLLNTFQILRDTVCRIR